MRRLELMHNLIKKESALANQSLFDTAMVDSLLADSAHHHHFYKYFIALSSIYGLHFDREFLQSFLKALEKQENFLKTVEKGFQLYDFLYNYGRYELCRQIIEHIVQALTKQVKQQQQEPAVWTYLFRACCALIQVHNQGMEMKEAWARIEAAHEIVENLKAIELGKTHLLDVLRTNKLFSIEIPSHEYAWFYLTASQTAFEDANFDASIQYCYR